MKSLISILTVNKNGYWCFINTLIRSTSSYIRLKPDQNKYYIKIRKEMVWNTIGDFIEMNSIIRKNAPYAEISNILKNYIKNKTKDKQQ